VNQTNELATSPEYSGFRLFPVIEVSEDGSMKPIEAKVHVSKKPYSNRLLGQQTALHLKDKTITISVVGLENKFNDTYDASALNEEEDVVVNRILNFTSRFCRNADDQEIYYVFKADNGVDITDFSFCAALESMLFGMDPEIVCSGDSAPNMDFNVASNMTPEHIKLKMEVFKDKSFYIKADTTTDRAITLPDDVVGLGADFADLTNQPQYFSAENPLSPLLIFPEMFPYRASVKVVTKEVTVAV